MSVFELHVGDGMKRLCFEIQTKTYLVPHPHSISSLTLTGTINAHLSPRVWKSSIILVNVPNSLSKLHRSLKMKTDLSIMYSNETTVLFLNRLDSQVQLCRPVQFTGLMLWIPISTQTISTSYTPTHKSQHKSNEVGKSAYLSFSSPNKIPSSSPYV